MIAERWGLTRRQLDEFSVASHEKAAAATDSGAFAGQIVPVDVDGAPFAADEGIRRGSTVETLAGLRPSFKPDGVIHAGNSSQISDGAAALLVMTPQRARDLGLTPIVRYHSGAVVGADPVLMLTGPIPATERLLKRAGVALSEIGVYEVNEAFAPVPLAWLRDTGADPAASTPWAERSRLATRWALRVPVFDDPDGASYARPRAIRFGLQTMCEGGGTANATLVELVA